MEFYHGKSLKVISHRFIYWFNLVPIVNLSASIWKLSLRIYQMNICEHFYVHFELIKLIINLTKTMFIRPYAKILPSSFSSCTVMNAWTLWWYATESTPHYLFNINLKWLLFFMLMNQRPPTSATEVQFFKTTALNLNFDIDQTMNLYKTWVWINKLVMQLLKSISELIRTQKLIIAHSNHMQLVFFLFFCSTTKMRSIYVFIST